MSDLQEDSTSCYKAVVRECVRHSHQLSSASFFPLNKVENNLLSMKCCLADFQIVSKGVEIDGLGFIPEGHLFIAQVKRGESSHFVLIKRHKEDDYFVYDPAHGDFWLDAPALEREMTGKGLLVQNRREKIATRRFPRFIPSLFGLSLLFLTLVRTICGVAFLFSVNEAIPSFWTWVSLGFFLLSSGLTFWVNNSLLKKHHKDVTLPLMQKENKREIFEKSSKVVLGKLSFYNGVLNKLTFFAISLVLFWNMDFWLFVIFIASLFLGFSFVLVARSSLSERKARLSYEEEKALIEKTDEKGFSKLWKKANRLSLLSLLPQLMTVGVTVGLIGVYLTLGENMNPSSLLTNLIMVSGSVFYLLKVVEEWDKVQKLRSIIYSLGEPYLELVEKSTRKCYTFLAKRRHHGNGSGNQP